MEFDLREISLAAGVSAGNRISLLELAGKKYEFRSGLSYPILLPAKPADYAQLAEPEITLGTLDGWSRVFRYPDGNQEKIHVIANTETENGELSFVNVELGQSLVRRGPKPAVKIVGEEWMGLDRLGDWLFELADQWALAPEEKQRQFVLMRPGRRVTSALRIGWVGPEVVGHTPTARRLRSLGLVHGANILPIVPRSFPEVRAKIAGLLPVDGVVVCRHFARHITEHAIHESIPRELILMCDSTDMTGLEGQVVAWTEIAREAAHEKQAAPAEEGEILLAIMLRGMLSHAKVGPNKHCQKETVLKGVKARRLNVPAASLILNRHTETYLETKESEAIFLTKDHNDGVRYFLNASQMERIRALASI